MWLVATISKYETATVTIPVCAHNALPINADNRSKNQHDRTNQKQKTTANFRELLIMYAGA